MAGTRSARTLLRLRLSRRDYDLVRVVVSSPCESSNSGWLIKSKSEILSVTSHYDATDVQGDQKMRTDQVTVFPVQHGTSEGASSC